jgi:DNA-directed RNA polymerase specialized sigma24 family protein
MLSAIDRLRTANRSAARRRRASGAPTLVAVPASGSRRTTPAMRRQRLAAAITRCARRDRVVLGLMLVEGLSPSEAADALGISVARLQRVYGETLAELRLVWRGLTGSSNSRVRRAAGPVRLRKAV